MASLTLRNGSYRARISRKEHPTICKSFKTEQEALKWIRQIEAQLELGIYQEQIKQNCIPVDVSLHEAVERYISSHTAQKKNSRSESGILRLIAKRWVNRKLTSIGKQDVLALKEDLLTTGRSASTINHYLNAISKLHQTAINEWGLNVNNPILGIKRMPEPQGRIKRLKPEAEKVLLDHSNQSSFKPLSAIIILAIETGMRFGELLSLRCEDIDIINRKALLRQTKNGQSRVVPLTSRAKTILEELLLNKNSELVLPYSKCRVRKHFVKTVTRAKLSHQGLDNPFNDLRFHDLRHEALSRLSDKGLNVMELAHISGHKTLSMLRRYTHPCHETLLIKLDKNSYPHK